VIGFCVICFGGHTKSTEAGNSVPDWPTSWGSPAKEFVYGGFGAFFLFGIGWAMLRKAALAYLALLVGVSMVGMYLYYGPQINELQGWWTIETVRVEHTHRLLAGLVSLATMILYGTLLVHEKRPWVRKLGLFAVIGVLCQALLGGLTVKLVTPPIVSALHGTLAQFVFSIFCSIAVVTGPRWFSGETQSTASDGRVLRKQALWLFGAFILQVSLGAALRHSKFDFETGQGGSVFWWHFAAHMAGLLFLLHWMGKVTVRILRHHGQDERLLQPLSAMALFVVFQIGLGVAAFVYRLLVPSEALVRPWPKTLLSTAHVAFATLTLSAIVLLAWRAIQKSGPAAAASPQPTPAVQATPAGLPEGAAT
jgi:cytochrome c oxidase assembly protein subunit 15